MVATACKPASLHYRIFPGVWVRHQDGELFKAQVVSLADRQVRLVSPHPGVRDRRVSFAVLDAEYREAMR